MKKLNLIICALILTVSVVGVSCSFFTKDALTSAIDEAIGLLEAKKYEDFLNRFVHPDDKAKMPDMKKVAENLNKTGDDILAALKKAKEQQPEYNADKTMATFRFDADSNLKRKIPLIFKKTNEVWYIMN